MANCDIAGWVLRKKAKSATMFFSSPWVRRWLVLNLAKREVEEYTDATRFELVGSFQMSEVLAVKKVPFKPDRIALFFLDSAPLLELKISSAEERDIWYEALLAMHNPPGQTIPAFLRPLQNRGWGDLGFAIGNARDEEEEQQVEEEQQPVADIQREPSSTFTEPAPFFSIQETASTSSFTTAASSTPLPTFHATAVPRTSNLRNNYASPRTSQNLIDSQHMYMGKARSIALSINRDAQESLKKKAVAAAVPFRKVVVPVLQASASQEEATDAQAFVKTAKQIQLLSQVIESEFPTAQDESSVRAIVDLMFKVTIAEKHAELMVQGEPCDRMFVIEQGEVGVYTQDFANRPAELEHCKHAGQCFGVHNVLYHQPGPFTIKTHVEHSVFWVLPRNQYLELVYSEQKRLVQKKANALDRVWLLNKYIDLALLDRIAETMEIEQYRRGDILVRAGNGGAVNRVYIVVEGALKLGRTLLLQKNDVFGESSLVEHSKAVVDQDLVCDTETCEVISLRVRDVEEIVGPIKVYIVKKFTGGHFLEVEDLDLEFARIVERDKETVQRVTAMVRMSTTDGAEEPHIDFPDLEYDKEYIKPLDPSLDLDTLKLVAQLGRGQFGVVHRAVHVPSGVGYALKVLRGCTITLNGWESMVEQERDAMAELTNKLRSPFLTHLYNWFGDFKNCYLVLELCSGGNLFELIKNKQFTLTLQHIRYYIASTVLALEAMHSISIIHRDVKPENSMLTSDGKMKLADFGISKKAMRTFSFCGTPDYMAPEMLTSRGYGNGVDYWATGIMLFELVAGYAPFSDFDSAEIYEKTLAYADSHALQFPKKNEVQGDDLLTAECQSLILALLHPAKNKRLGVKYPGVSAIKQHEFFFEFDWEALGEQNMQAPWHLPPQQHKLSNNVALEDNKYDAQLNFTPDDITGWTLKF